MFLASVRREVMKREKKGRDNLYGAGPGWNVLVLPVVTPRNCINPWTAD